jgi:hypothetical protein
MKKYFWLTIRAIIISALALVIYNFLIDVSEGQEYNPHEICEIIYIIEGKEKARQPYGIETIECSSREKCKRICHNTVINNLKRFQNQTEENDFLTFLARRYCPPNWKIWLKNLKWYLDKR